MIERYRSLANGQIRPVQAEEPKTKIRHKRRRTIASVGTVKKMRPSATRSLSAPGST